MRTRRRWLGGSLLALAIAALVPAAVVLGEGGGPDDGPQPSFEAASALGSGFTYQGRLLDGASPANGVFDFQFVLYDEGTGGAQVGPIVNRFGVAVVGGFFTVQLDFGGEAFTGQARWLDVGVREAGSASFFSTLSPRQPLTAVPYALYARAAALALPFGGTGSTTGTDSLLSISQEGTGVAVAGTRTYAGTVQGPAVYGMNAGAGAGVQGESSASEGVGARGLATGEAGSGVQGSATGVRGAGGRFSGETGIVASASGSGAALELAGGALKVTGSVRPAFRHQVVTTGGGANLCGTNGTVLESPLTDGNPDALLFVTHVSTGGATASEGDARMLVLAYDPSTTCAAGAQRWVVFATGSALAEGETFNVLVISQ